MFFGRVLCHASCGTDCPSRRGRMCSTTEKKLAKLTELGKQRFRVLKYEMVSEATANARRLTGAVYRGRLSSQLRAFSGTCLPLPTEMEERRLVFVSLTQLSLHLR